MKLSALRLSAFGLLTLLFVLLTSPLLPAQDVKTTPPSDSLQVGDIFNYSLVLQMDKEYDHVIFPDTSSFPPDIEMVGKQQFKTSNFTDSLSYRLQFFAVEDLTIPPLPVKLFAGEDSTVLYTDPATLHFKTVVAEADTTFKPLKPIFSFPRAIWPWVLAGLLLAGLLIWWFFFRKTEEPEQKESIQVVRPFYNPLEALEETLHAIKKEVNIAETKDFKRFYSEVGDAIRNYFEELYEIPALESTTRELLRDLDSYGVDHEMIEYTRQVLRQADLVKFAKYTPTLDDAWKTYQYAMDFLDRAKFVDTAKVTRLREEYEQQFESSEQNKGGQDGMG